MFLLLDGNNIAWAGYYGLERAMRPDSDERKSRVAMLGMAAGILGTIARAAEPPGVESRTRVTRVALCFDEGRPVRRRGIFPPYQTGREHDPKFIANEATIVGAIDEFCRVAATWLPIEVLRGKNTEADDLIAGLVQANPKLTKRIVSTDRDFLQLIGPSTSIYSPVKKLVIDQTNFGEAATPSGAAMPLRREQYLDYRALIGDPSDSLPGVPGIGTLSAVRLLAHAPIETYFDDPAAARAALGRKVERIERGLADGTAREIIERNRTLMDLRLPAPCWDELDALSVRGSWDRPRFEAWLAEQRFGSIDEAALFPRLESLAELAG